MCFAVANYVKSLQKVYPLFLCVASFRCSFWYTQGRYEVNETHLERPACDGHRDAYLLGTARFHLVRQRSAGIVVPGPYTPADHPDLARYRRLPDLPRREGPQGGQTHCLAGRFVL